MKIATITFHRALNYGAVFQTYALQKALERFGNKVYVLDYRSSFIEEHYRKKKWYEYLTPKKIAIILLLNGYSITDRNTFSKFVSKHIITSENTYNSSNIRESESFYDAFIAGSDQIWNYKTAGFDKNYFLEFVSDERKKISYAASIGLDEIPEEYASEYKRLLERFRHISVREDKGKEALERLLQRDDIRVDIDPTMLLNAEQWATIETCINTPSKYVLVYLLYENKKILAFARNLAKTKGCKVLYINDRLFPAFGMRNIRNCKPDEWLYLFRNASYIVTNSFHGTAFSIIFNKQFWTDLLPSMNPVNSRIVTLLRKLNIKGHVISNGATIMDDEINYDDVRPLLLHYIDDSYSYLKEITCS